MGDRGLARSGAVGGVSPEDLAPYGEADLAVALTCAPERLQCVAAEANPFDERFLVPEETARRMGEAVTRLVSLSHDGGAAGREEEVRARLEQNYCTVRHALQVRWCVVISFLDKALLFILRCADITYSS